MKKRLFIIAISIARFIITGAGQEIQNGDTVRNQYKCFVSIKTVNGEKIEAALSSLSADSVLLTAVDEKYVRAGGKYIKTLREDPDTAISVNDIRTFRIKYDPNIIYRDELVKRKKQLRKENAGKIFEIAVVTVLTVALLPVAAVTATPELTLLPLELIPLDGSRKVCIQGNNLQVTKSYRAFRINGNNDRYIKMVKHLTKSKTNPFENSLAKN